jgi:hypothetical protein
MICPFFLEDSVLLSEHNNYLLNMLPKMGIYILSNTGAVAHLGLHLHYQQY